ncbi:MAG: DUF2064 domain-containing protein, partial [Pyrinomonadaceae bacterium]|nr:DUF2064 domain-containing protein [Sphingobacteriaceae bacterium]
YQLTTEILIEGINNLNTHDSVLGPAYDGGYYLLGLKKAIPEIFENIHWSTETVFDETLNTFKEMNLSYALLPILNDIDTEEDLKAANIDY